MLRLILEGRVARPDLVIFADTGAEPEHVYDVVAREKHLCQQAGIEFAVVAWRDLSKETGKSVKVPLFTVNKETGKKGMLWRNCTSRFKIEPIEKELRTRGWKPIGIKQYMGISMDEIKRMKDSRVSYIRLEYPLIDLGWSRTDCLEYLTSLGVEGAKSACVFCPYKNREEWERLKLNTNDLNKALEYDAAIRNARDEAGFTCYVHPSRVPLAQALDLAADEVTWDDNCEGYCGL